MTPSTDMVDNNEYAANNLYFRLRCGRVNLFFLISLHDLYFGGASHVYRGGKIGTAVKCKEYFLLQQHRLQKHNN